MTVAVAMPVYLDNAATTCVDPDVLGAMTPYLVGPDFGNPSSAHALGVGAERAMTLARERVLLAVDAPAGAYDVVFTSGGTEADALAVLGCARASRARHIVVSAIEHSAVLGAADMLAAEGFSVDRVAPDATGRLPVSRVAEAVRPDSALVAVMLVQNEIGVIQPVHEIVAAVHARAPGCAVVVDAVQAFGKVPVDLSALGADALALSAHKIHGPKGVGALVVRRGRRLRPLWAGKQQGGVRGGTENVAGIVGFGVAVELARRTRPEASIRMREQREELWEAIHRSFPGARRNGEPTYTAPHVLSVAIPGAKAEVLLHALEGHGIYVSAGSACAAKDRTPSHVLRAIGVPDSHGVLRFSLARTTTAADIDAATAAIERVARELALG